MRKKSCLGPTHKKKNLDRCDNYITGLHIINILLLLYSSHYIGSLELIYPMNETSNRDHQVTSKEILDVAFEKSKSKFTTPRQTIQDTEELQSYQQTKRKEFEQHINKNRLNLGQWTRYAKWEIENNHDFPRARSILERALDVNIQHVPFWIQYIQLELSHKNINHARNLMERAINTLPRVNKLWFLYVQTEEMLKNYPMVRAVFERWLDWHPDTSAWDAYINFEARYEEKENVRTIFKKYVHEFPNAGTWYKWIKYEMENNRDDVNTVRAVFESAVDTLLSNKLEENDDDEEFATIISSWTSWEVSCGEASRANEIFKLLLDNKTNKLEISDQTKSSIYTAFVEFEKNFGNKDSIEQSVLIKRRIKYEQEIQNDPYDYDSWWKYMTLLQNSLNKSDLENAFKKVTGNVVHDKHKSIKWRRYIMFWIWYAFWEEMTNNNPDSAREIWNNCLKVIPHKLSTFAKVWIGYSEFELRNSEDGLAKARKILGRAIGQTSINKPKIKIFKYYIDLEKKLGDWNRVRLLFQKWLEVSLLTTSLSELVIEKYVEFESSIEEYDRCDLILSSARQLSENPEYSSSFNLQKLLEITVEFYKEEMQYDKIRKIYRALLDKDPNTHNWISFALFESSIPSAEQLEEYLQGDNEEFEATVDELQIESTRKIFEEAMTYFKDKDDKESRLVIIEAWRDFEEVNGSDESLSKVTKRLPVIVRKRRTVGSIEEEYIDYIFPDDESKKLPGKMSKFLANAKKWAQQN